MDSPAERFKALQERAMCSNHVSFVFDDPMQELHNELLSLWGVVDSTVKFGDLSNPYCQIAIRNMLETLNAKASEVIHA